MVKIMTREALEHVKLNINTYMEHYINKDDPEEWIPRELGSDAFVDIDADIGINLVKLDGAKEIDNIKILYTNMKRLNDSFAGDERLWAGLTHTYYYDYILERWPEMEPDRILERFFFNSDKQRAYLNNGIARLWWYGRMLYDEDDLERPFRMLDYAGSDLMGVAFRIFTNNWANSERSRKLFFQGLYRFTEKSRKRANRDIVSAAVMEMNGLWGSYIVDLCDDEFVIDTIYQAANRTYVESCNKPIEMRVKDNELTDSESAVIEFLREHHGLCSTEKFKEFLLNDLKMPRDSVDSLLSSMTDKNRRQAMDFHPAMYRGEPHVVISDRYINKSCLETLQTFFGEQIDVVTAQAKKVFGLVCSLQSFEYSLTDLIELASEKITILWNDLGW